VHSNHQRKGNQAGARTNLARQSHTQLEQGTVEAGRPRGEDLSEVVRTYCEEIKAQIVFTRAKSTSREYEIV